MNILIIGHGRHGKDTVGELLAKKCLLKSASSSEFACRNVIFPSMGERYATWQECFADRENHRAEWFNLIAAYNAKDPTRLAREIWAEYNIYVGLRNITEYRAILKEKLADLVVWVDASDRVAPEWSTSFNIPFCQDEMFYFDNNGPVETLQRKVDKLADVVNFIGRNK